jgi:hypothetical protein
MTASEKPTIVELMAAVMGDVRAVAKTDRNSQQGYDFRGIDAVVNAAGPAFRKYGIVPMPMLEAVSYRDVQTSTGKPSREVTVQVRFRFHGPAGDYMDAVVPGEAMDFGDKGTPKAMSVALRIVLLQALALPTHETDPDSQSYERASRNGHAQEENQAPEPSPADDARQQLLNVCQAMQLDPRKVADTYFHGRSIRLQDESDPARIQRFAAQLRSGEVTVESADRAA